MPRVPTRQEIEQILARVFTPEQAAALAEILDTFREELERAADMRELKQQLAALTEQINRLAGVVREQAEAQPRTEGQIGRFTDSARRVLTFAQEEAERLNHNYIGSEHLLLGLIREESGIAGRVLRSLNVQSGQVIEMVERITGPGRRAPFSKIDLPPRTRRVIELAVEEARGMGHHYIGTEHLLLGLVRQGDGVAMDILRQMGVTPEQIRQQTLDALHGQSPSS